jgi:AbrB family looped-hinge helix DNA binding protein
MAARATAIQYLTTTKIGEKGQLTVPKQFRKELGLGAGSPFAVLRLGNGLILLPEEHRFEALVQEVSAAILSGGGSPKEFLATLPEARDEIFEARYGASRAGRRGSARKARRRKK